MNRALRRELEKRGDALLARVPAFLVADVAGLVAIVAEGAVRVLSKDLAFVELAMLGLADVFVHIEEERARRPDALPAVVITKGFASVAFVPVRRCAA